MDIAMTLERITELSIAERIQIVQAILESISIEDSIPDLTDEQKREIDRRISAYEANPEDVMTWDEVKASIRLRVAEKSIRDSQRFDPPKSPLVRGTLKRVPVPPFQGG